MVILVKINVKEPEGEVKKEKSLLSRLNTLIEENHIIMPMMGKSLRTLMSQVEGLPLLVQLEKFKT